MEWTSRVTAISLEMVLPGLFGFWLDRRLGTLPLLLVVGVVIGFVTGMWQLLKLAGSLPEDRRPPRRPSKHS